MRCSMTLSIMRRKYAAAINRWHIRLPCFRGRIVVGCGIGMRAGKSGSLFAAVDIYRSLFTE